MKYLIILLFASICLVVQCQEEIYDVVEFIEKLVEIADELENAGFMQDITQQKTSVESQRDVGNFYLETSLAKPSTQINWIAEHGNPSNSIWAHTQAGDSFQETLDGLKSDLSGASYNVQVLFVPARVQYTTITCKGSKALIRCCAWQPDIYAFVGSSMTGSWNKAQLDKQASSITNNPCNCDKKCPAN